KGFGYRHQIEVRYAGITPVTKDVRKGVFDHPGRGGMRVAGNGPSVSKKERAQVVHPDDVVGMMMGVEDGVQLSESLAKRLKTKIRAGVNYQVESTDRHERRTA